MRDRAHIVEIVPNCGSSGCRTHSLIVPDKSRVR